MIVWGALLIPLLTAVALYLLLHHRIVWWELLVPMGVCLLLVSAAKVTISSSQTSDTEYLTTWAASVEYHEPWSELVVKTRTTTDSNGNTTVEVYTEVEYHGPRWFLVGPGGRHFHTDRDTFEWLCGRWQSRVKRESVASGMVIQDGYRFTSHWPGSDETLYPVAFTGSYTNKVKAAPSVFGHRKVGKEEKERLGLFDYTDVRNWRQQMVLGSDNSDWERALELANAKLGAAHQVRVWLLVFWNQPLEAAIAQENLWQGGNKNELVLCVGLDEQGRVTWGRVFSWTERETFKAEVRGLIEDQLGQGFDGVKLVNGTAALVPGGWQRKEFKDFDYLTVEPPTWAVVLVYLLVTLTSVGIGVWAVGNEHNPNQTVDWLAQWERVRGWWYRK
jgi:hypothetical protein